MTQQELDALQGLCDGATAGEWHTVEVGDNKTPWVVDSHERCVAGGTPGGIGPRANDAAFIAAARTALPELIAEVRRLQKRCKDAIGWANYLCSQMLRFNADGYSEPEDTADEYKAWRDKQPAKEDT